MDATVNQKVKELLAKGESRDQIRKELVAQGIAADSIDDVLDILAPETLTQPTPVAPVVAQPQPIVQPDHVAPPVTPVAAPPQSPKPKGRWQFFKELPKTIYSPETYAEVIGRRTGQMVAFFLKFALILLLISAVASVASFVKAGQSITGQVPASINTFLDVIPQTLQVHIVNGQVSTNAKEPVYIKVPGSNPNKPFENLVVIDTKTPFSATQFQNYHTAAWLTKDSIIYYSNYDASSGQSVQATKIQVTPLTQVKNVTLSRAYLQGLVTKYQPWLRLVIPVLIVLGVVALYLFHAAKLIYLLFPALLLLFGAKLMKMNLRYRQVYNVAVFASVPVFVLQTILRDALHAPWPTFTTTVLILLVALVNLAKAKPLLNASPLASPAVSST